MSHAHETRQASSSGAATARTATVDPGRSSLTAQLSTLATSGTVQRKAADPTNGAEAPAAGKATGKDGGKDGGKDRAQAGDVQALATQGISGPATSLPYLDRIQQLFGRHDVTGIQAHIGGQAAQACKGMGAKAFATGNHVAFAGPPDLHTAAHEAAHVVQQRAGVHVDGGVGQEGDEYEHAADRAADAVVAGQSAEALLDGGHAQGAKPAGGAAKGGQTPGGGGAGGSGAGSGGAGGGGGGAGGGGALQAKKDVANAEKAPCAECGPGGCQCDGKPAGGEPASGSAGQPASVGKPAVQKSPAEGSAVQLQDDGPGTQPVLTPPPGCDGSFCQPFPTQQDAINDKNLKWWALRIGISAKVSGKVLSLWDQWAAGGTGVQDITGSFGGDFTNSPTTADTTTFLLGQIRAAVAARPPLAPGATATVPLATLIPTAVAEIDDPTSMNQMNFNIIGDIPGNIAGGIGKDQAANPVGAKPSPQNDARLVNGSVTITGLPGGGQRVTPSFSFTVNDTLDLCPGNCGASSEQIATVPMSRWEASGIAGDVPYTVRFAPPATLMGAFDVLPPGVSPTPTPTPSPTPSPTPTPTPTPGPSSGGGQR
ncbi:MAG TPA: DUF4157 domain-containing protein [Kofleriaceae bacterium]